MSSSLLPGADLGGFLRFPETGQVYQVFKIIFYSDLHWYKGSDRNTLIEQSTTLIEQSHFVFLLRTVSS